MSRLVGNMGIDQLITMPFNEGGGPRHAPANDRRMGTHRSPLTFVSGRRWPPPESGASPGGPSGRYTGHTQLTAESVSHKGSLTGREADRAGCLADREVSP